MYVLFSSLDMSVYHPETVRSFRGLSEDQVQLEASRRNDMLQQSKASAISLTMPMQLEELLRIVHGASVLLIVSRIEGLVVVISTIC